jgi:hypothetical protein
LEALERRVMVQNLHIQQAKLEEDRGAYQPGEQLEEDLAEENLSEGKGTAELESAVEWPLSATKRDKDSRGDRADLPIEKTEVQQRRLHTKSQPLEQLDEVIEEIRRLMLRSAQEAVSKGKLSRRKPARVAGKKKSNNNNKAMERMDSSKELFGIQVDFDSMLGSS